MQKLNITEIVEKMRVETPNNFELGSKYRKFILSFTNNLDSLCKEYPNDYDLGSTIRNMENKLKITCQLEIINYFCKKIKKHKYDDKRRNERKD